MFNTVRNLFKVGFSFCFDAFDPSRSNAFFLSEKRICIFRLLNDNHKNNILMYKFLLTIIFIQALYNQKTCDFDKKCFNVFINFLYIKGGILDNQKITYISFLHTEDEKLFSKKIKVKDRLLHLEKRKSIDKNNLLTIISIAKADSINFKVDFLYEAIGGIKNTGTVSIRFVNKKPVALERGFSTQVN